MDRTAIEKKMLAVQIATDSIRIIQQTAVLVATGLLWLAFSSDSKIFLSDPLLWTAIALFALTFVFCIWVHHNYIWALVDDHDLIRPTYQRIAFALTYVTMVSGVGATLFFLISRIAGAS